MNTIRGKLPILISIGSFFISIGSLYISYLRFQSSQENEKRYCQTTISELKMSILSHAYTWDELFERKYLKLNNTDYTELQRTRDVVKSKFSQAKPYLGPVERMRFKRKVFQYGEEKNQEDSIGSYFDYLGRTDFSHFSVKATLSVIKSTGKSVKSLSRGIVGLLDKVNCDNS